MYFFIVFYVQIVAHLSVKAIFHSVSIQLLTLPRIAVWHVCTYCEQLWRGMHAVCLTV